jgi:hypothetical protein
MSEATWASFEAFEATLVERPFEGAAPTAFRIWAAGQVVADDRQSGSGLTPVYRYFTENSARLLIAEQTARGRLYPFDFDHLSLTSERPPTAGRAAGWHRLEVRKDAEGRSELWAVGIEWCADVKEGLEQKVPLWRYYSPAFGFNTATLEIVSYTNCAICINPRTHNIPELAANSVGQTQKDPVMDEKAILALLDELLADGADSDKIAVVKAFVEAAGEEEPPASQKTEGEQTAEGGDDEPPPDSEKVEDKDKAAKTESEKTSKIVKPVAPKKPAPVSQDFHARLERLEREELATLVSKHGGISPAMQKALESIPFDKAKKIVETFSAPSAPRQTRATAPEGALKRETTAAGAAEDPVIDRVLGLTSHGKTLGFGQLDRETHSYRLPTMTPTQARKIAAEAAKKVK